MKHLKSTVFALGMCALMTLTASGCGVMPGKTGDSTQTSKNASAADGTESTASPLPSGASESTKKQ